MKNNQPMQKEPATQPHNAWLETLKKRFEQHAERHKTMHWEAIETKLKSNPKQAAALQWMEATGGQPDVLAYDPQTGVYTFYDCAPETPQGRRSVCYDPQALRSRKTHKPPHSALGMAAEAGVQLLDEEQYRFLQQFGPFDTKTSSWLLTPHPIRALGGAIFGDWRYGQVFIYHNDAESYYASRGFRTKLNV